MLQDGKIDRRRYQRKKLKSNLSAEIKWFAWSLVIYIIANLLFYSFITIVFKTPKCTISNQTAGISFVEKIAINNMKNLFMYILLAPIMPILYCCDIFITDYNLFSFINNYGLIPCLSKMDKHGILESINIVFYTAISYRLMVYFYKCEYRMKSYLKKMYQFRYHILLSIIMLLISAILEGLLY